MTTGSTDISDNYLLAGYSVNCETCDSNNSGPVSKSCEHGCCKDDDDNTVCCE